MSDLWLKDMMKRLLTMEKQALTDEGVTTVGGVHYFPYEQETFPYFVNRLDGLDQIVQGVGEDEYVYEAKVDVLLVVAHLTSGYKSENADVIYDYIVYLINYFSQNRSLQSTDYPNAPQYLDPIDMDLDLSTGVSVFTNAGISAQQVGTRFTVSIQYQIPRPL